MRYIRGMPPSNAEWSTRHSVQATAERTVALVNALTADTPTPDTIADVLREHGEADPVEVTANDVEDLRAAALLLRAVFATDHVDTAASMLNRLLRRGVGTLRLTSHDGQAPGTHTSTATTTPRGPSGSSPRPAWP